MDHPIALAYKARCYVPTESYRRGDRRKMYNPIRTTPALIQAMIHLGKEGMGLRKARERARAAVQEPDAARYVEEMDWEGLLAFLDTIAVFLKAGPKGRKEKGMRNFEDRGAEHKEPGEIVKEAQTLAGEIREVVVLNKLKQMGGHVTAARDKWEALAALARFYPRKGIPKGYVDKLVEALETLDLQGFKQLVAHSLVFYEARSITKGVK